MLLKENPPSLKIYYLFYIGTFCNLFYIISYTNIDLKMVVKKRKPLPPSNPTPFTNSSMLATPPIRDQWKFFQVYFHPSNCFKPHKQPTYVNHLILRIFTQNQCMIYKQKGETSLTKKQKGETSTSSTLPLHPET